MTIIQALNDAEVSDWERRRLLFAGNLFVYGPQAGAGLIAVAAQDVLEEVLGPNAIWAQQRIGEVEFAGKFAAAARRLSHILPEVARALVTDFRCDPDTTYVGAPSVVATTGVGFIAHGLGVRQHPHRDTWYAAPTCQLNWWMPLYDLDASASFAFHPLYWDVPVHNSSSDFDYDTWLAESRVGHGDPSLADPLAQPRPLDPIELTPEIRVSCPAGGVVISSAAQLYSSVPNEASKTNFSLHFCSVNESDLITGRGAANLDAEASGSSLSSFVRCSNLAPLPHELVEHELRRRSDESTARRRRG